MFQSSPFKSVLLAVLVLLPLSAPAVRGAEELRPLRQAIAAHLEDPGDAAESFRLGNWLSLSEATAAQEKDGARRAGLQAELAALRERLAAARPSAAKMAAGEPATATARIQGTVRIATTGAGVANVAVTLYDAFGVYTAGTATAEGGGFAFPDLAAGTYYLDAQPYQLLGYVAPQIFDHLDCPFGCYPNQGTAIELAAGATSVADFDLKVFGRIEGTVRAAESGTPLAYRTVRLFSDAGSAGATALTDETGHYSVAVPLGSALYYVAVADGDDRPGMVYSGVPCQLSIYDYYLGCPLAGAVLVAAGDGELVAGIDFSLPLGVSISGRVVSRSSGAPLASAYVHLYDAFHQTDRVATTDQTGAYRLAGLIPGEWNLAAELAGYTVQAFRNRDCLALELCGQAGFEPVALQAGEQRTGVDFALALRGTATGRVVDQQSREPLLGAYVSALSPTGTVLVSSVTDTAGFFTLSYLPAGELIFKAEALGYLPEIYENLDPRAGLAGARRVTIRPGEVTPGIEISPSRLGGLRGRVTDRASGAPVGSCIVFARLLDAPPLTGDWSGYCGYDGTFELPNLWPGSYRVWVVPQTYDYTGYVVGAGSCNLDQSYAREPLCDLGPGSQVTVGTGQVGQLGDLPLEKGAVITGFVNASGGSPEGAEQRRLRVFDAAGRRVAEQAVWYFPYGYSFVSLAPGSYRVVFEGDDQWASQAWNGVPCNRWYCDPNLGQPLTLAAGQEAANVDFDLLPLPPYSGCTGSATAICLQEGRFKVETTWHDFLGQSGPGQAVRVTDETAYFYFFDPGNVELMVKALNACSPELGQRFWVFAAGLTNVQVEIKVTDTLTGAVRTYGNPLGQVIAPILDVGAFGGCTVPEPSPASQPVVAAGAAVVTAREGEEGGYGCFPSDQTACLAAGRFQVFAQYQVSENDPVYFARVHQLTGDSSAFTFFNDSNIELLVKVLDACQQPLAGHWVFAAGLTDVKVHISVKDLATGELKSYSSGYGPFQPIFDLGTFAGSCD